MPNPNHKRPQVDALIVHFAKDIDDLTMLVFLDEDTIGDGVCLGQGRDPAAACDDAISRLHDALESVYNARKVFRGEAL